MKKAEDTEELIIRMDEVEGKETLVNIQLPVAIRSAHRLNLIEFPLKEAVTPTLKCRSVKVKFRSREIVTLGILPVN